jgi:hypothetical protein
MKPAPFAYVRAESIEEALDGLAEHGREAKVLAGGQSLVPALNMRLVRPTALVDINHVSSMGDASSSNGALTVARSFDKPTRGYSGTRCSPRHSRTSVTSSRAIEAR